MLHDKAYGHTCCNIQHKVIHAALYSIHLSMIIYTAQADGQAASKLEKLKAQHSSFKLEAQTRPEWGSSLKLGIRLRISLFQAFQLPGLLQKFMIENKETVIHAALYSIQSKMLHYTAYSHTCYIIQRTFMHAAIYIIQSYMLHFTAYSYIFCIIYHTVIHPAIYSIHSYMLNYTTYSLTCWTIQHSFIHAALYNIHSYVLHYTAYIHICCIIQHIVIHLKLYRILSYMLHYTVYSPI